jgi:hypothetical protein
MVEEGTTPIEVELGWFFQGAVNGGHREETMHQDDVRGGESRYVMLPDLDLSRSCKEMLASVSGVVMHQGHVEQIKRRLWCGGIPSNR